MIFLIFYLAFSVLIQNVCLFRLEFFIQLSDLRYRSLSLPLSLSLSLSLSLFLSFFLSFFFFCLSFLFPFGVFLRKILLRSKIKNQYNNFLIQWKLSVELFFGFWFLFEQQSHMINLRQNCPGFLIGIKIFTEAIGYWNFVAFKKIWPCFCALYEDPLVFFCKMRTNSQGIYTWEDEKNKRFARLKLQLMATKKVNHF